MLSLHWQRPQETAKRKHSRCNKGNTRSAADSRTSGNSRTNNYNCTEHTTSTECTECTASTNNTDRTNGTCAPTVSPVPTATAAPTYSMEQLAVAATGLIDAGKMQDVQNTLASLGAQTLMDLPQEKYGEFASAIKAIGAVI